MITLADIKAAIAIITELWGIYQSVKVSMKENEIKGTVADGIKKSHEYLLADDKAHFNNIFTATVK
jgi:hypothetical protein